MTFQVKIEDYQAKINLELSNFFDSIIFENNHGFNQKLLEVLKEFTMRGGKRLRPILVVEGFKAFSSTNSLTNNDDLNIASEEELIKLSICMELMQTSFLIHDDIMDKAKIRRGKETVNAILGDEEAILAGNIAMVLGEKVILDSKFNDSLKLNALKMFNKIIETTNYGQLLDLKLGMKNISEVSEDEISQIHIMKTAKYTIEGPLQLGAILSGAIEKDVEKISKFALPLGRAFQIKDDLLGIFGEENKLGKSILSDIKENKKTLLVWFAFMKSDEEVKEFIQFCLGNGDLSADDFFKLKEIIKVIHSKDYSIEKIDGLVEQAKHYITHDNTINLDTKNFLLDLIDYLVKREF
jgi:geranylgeranyl diphosphate synthase, type I